MPAVSATNSAIKSVIFAISVISASIFLIRVEFVGLNFIKLQVAILGCSFRNYSN